MTSVRGAVGASIRNDVYEGRDYIVAPVVMMVGNAVIRSMGSRGPEYVPLTELMRAPDGWNGRPVVLNHPVNSNGGPELANSPKILEANRFGYIFHAAVVNGKLTAEMWLDPARAKEVGHDAIRFVERVQAGEIADVSVGALVAVEETSGTTASGQKYEYIWHDLVPDHLAALPEGVPGACSVELGCGTPRAAAQATPVEVPIMNMFQQLLAMAASPDKGESDSETRGMLSNALRAVEPGFDSVYEVYPASSTVIYLTCPEDKYLWKRRKYSTNADGTATLGDAEEVLPRTTFETVGAEEAPSTETGTTLTLNVELKGLDEAVEAANAVAALTEVVPVAACGCGGHSAAAAPSQKAEEDMAENQKLKDLAGRLIACEASPFNEEDRAALEVMSEARLSTLVSEFESVKKETAQPVATPAGASTQTEEQWLASAPASVQAIVARAKVEEKAAHARLVNVLKGAQSHYTEEQLRAKSLDQLEELDAVLGASAEQPVSYGGRFMPEPAGASDAAAVMDHSDSFAKALKSRYPQAN